MTHRAKLKHGKSASILGGTLSSFNKIEEFGNLGETIRSKQCKLKIQSGTNNKIHYECCAQILYNTQITSSCSTIQKSDTCPGTV